MTTTSHATEGKMMGTERESRHYACCVMCRNRSVEYAEKGRNGVLKAGIGMSEFVSADTAINFHISATGPRPVGRCRNFTFYINKAHTFTKYGFAVLLDNII